MKWQIPGFCELCSAYVINHRVEMGGWWGRACPGSPKSWDQTQCQPPNLGLGPGERGGAQVTGVATDRIGMCLLGRAQASSLGKEPPALGSILGSRAAPSHVCEAHNLQSQAPSRCPQPERVTVCPFSRGRIETQG